MHFIFEVSPDRKKCYSRVEIDTRELAKVFKQELTRINATND